MYPSHTLSHTRTSEGAPTFARLHVKRRKRILIGPASDTIHIQTKIDCTIGEFGVEECNIGDWGWGSAQSMPSHSVTAGKLRCGATRR